MLKQLYARVRPALGELIRFAVVGATVTTLDFGVYIALTRSSRYWHHHLIIANSVAFCFGVVSSFLLNNFWTFRRDASNLEKRTMRFLSVVGSSYVLTTVLLLALLRLGLHDIIAKLVVTGLVGGWNFSMYRWWAFRK